MRKSIILLTALVLAATSLAAPALAAKSKKGSFTAQALPYPGPDGCNNSASQVTEAFKAPATGILTVTMVDFDGDWDLFVNDSSGSELGSATASQLTGDAPEEEVLVAVRKGSQVLMGPCNWAGGMSATVNWVFKATK
ncbi:MAG TPA: hypothetical protein VG929_04100 [Actinomycetota bacterium]|nr:hypothetical protein [Actinomycetota bacterium]